MGSFPFHIQEADVFQIQLRPGSKEAGGRANPHVTCAMSARLVREQTANCIKDLNALRAEA